ncbi:10748_t:CDS:2 [Entrophospora sp. SA101]|nr:10748_t:CDS:2 [Entrophospora sp. SA101]
MPDSYFRNSQRSPPSASPATGNKKQHIQEEHDLISQALIGQVIKPKEIVGGVPICLDDHIENHEKIYELILVIRFKNANSAILAVQKFYYDDDLTSFLNRDVTVRHLVEDRHNNNTYDPEAIIKCLMIFDEETNTWSLEIVKSSYHVNMGEFDNFETSSELQGFAIKFGEMVEENYNADVDVHNNNYSASSGDNSSNDSLSENGNDDASDSGESILNPEFVELASMMKTSLKQFLGGNNPHEEKDDDDENGDIFKYSLNENAVSGVFMSLIDRIWFGGVPGHSIKSFDDNEDEKEEKASIFSFHGPTSSMELGFTSIGKNGGKVCSREDASKDDNEADS